MTKLTGRITIEPAGPDRVTWCIAVGLSGRHDISVVGSEWGYLTDGAAVAAAKRWASRLRIRLVGVTP